MRFTTIFCLLFISLFALGADFNYACAQMEEGKEVKRQSISDRKKELAKKKEKQKAEEAAAMEELKQMHLDNQDKQTKKRMKRAQKAANKNNSGKRGFSLKNWFRKKARY